jgi:hypothetical protein
LGSVVIHDRIVGGFEHVFISVSWSRAGLSSLHHILAQSRGSSKAHDESRSRFVLAVLMVRAHELQVLEVNTE